MTPYEALRQCIEAMKEVDFADCGKDDARWHKLNAAQLAAEAALKVPKKAALADEVIAALDALQIGCTEPIWIGWQNGDGEEVGTRLHNAIEAYKAIPVAAQPAAAAVPEATDAMAMAIRHYDVFDILPDTALRAVAKSIYRDMLAAAPLPAVAPSGGVVEALHELALLMSDTIRGDYEPDSFTLQPAVHALAAVGIEFPGDDYLLTERESCVVVPVKPSAAMLKAMAESRAVDDEGEFPLMLDLLDFSGENKTCTVLQAAYVAAITATKD